MQRFGTAAVPTHTIGLAFLRADWHKAVSLILQVRPGEHPDVVAAREAWLVDRDLDRALTLMPRRVVAERCILESYKKQGGETRNAMGALSTVSCSTIPRLIDIPTCVLQDSAQPQVDVHTCLPVLCMERDRLGTRPHAWYWQDNPWRSCI